MTSTPPLSIKKSESVNMDIFSVSKVYKLSADKMCLNLLVSNSEVRKQQANHIYELRGTFTFHTFSHVSHIAKDDCDNLGIGTCCCP